MVGSPDGRSGNGDSGDGRPARAATFGHIVAIAFDRAGALYLLDELNHRVRQVAPDGPRTIQAYA